MLSGLGVFAHQHEREFPPAMVWGRNAGYQLGVGSTKDFISSRWTPAPLPDKQIIKVAAGGSGYGVLFADGSLYVWGTEAPSGMTPTPELVPGVWKSFALGNGFGVGINADDHYCAWGSQTNYATGSGSDVGRLTAPQVIGGSTTVSVVSCFQNGAFAITTDGSLLAHGSNVGGATGNGTSTGHLMTPTQIGSDTWIDIEGGREDAVALTTAGALYGWGAPRNGSSGFTTTKLVPTVVPGVPACTKLARRIAVATSFNGNAAITAAGAMYVFGANAHGQCFPPTISVKPPTLVSGVYKEFACAGPHSIYINGDDECWYLGANDGGSAPVSGAVGSVENHEKIGDNIAHIATTGWAVLLVSM